MNSYIYIRDSGVPTELYSAMQNVEPTAEELMVGKGINFGDKHSPAVQQFIHSTNTTFADNTMSCCSRMHILGDSQLPPRKLAGLYLQSLKRLDLCTY
jgi:hypothetical protein